jgi:hypothetical protein
VDLQHDPEDEDAFAAVRQALVERFEATKGGADRGWVADQLVDFKHSYLGGDLGRWTADDLSEILLEIYPRKVVLEPADHADVISGIAAFLRFLDAEGLRTGGEDGETLALLVEQAGARFDHAMADESKWGMGKRVFGGAAAQGVDVTDQAQLDAYVQAFNALPGRERDALLGQLPNAPAPRSLPPVVLAPHEELLAAAEASTLLGWVRGLVAYVGAGVKLTDRGNLRLADAKELVGRLGTGDRFDRVIGDRKFATRSSEELPDLHLTMELAAAAGFLVDDGSRLRPTDTAARPADDPVEAISLLWQALVDDVGPVQHRWRDDTYGYGWYAEDLDDRLIEWQLDMYGDLAGLDVALAADDAWADLLVDFDLDDEEPTKLELHREIMAHSLLGAFRRLEQLGVVRLEGADREPDLDREPDAEVRGTAHLTPLGVWVIQRQLGTFVSAPVVGALAEAAPDELFTQVVDLPEESARAEVRHWLDQRGADGLPSLVAALPTATETARGVAFSVLLGLGPAAVEAVEPLRANVELAPFRTVLRVDAGVATEDDMVAADPEGWVRLLGAVIELRGPDAAAVWAAPAAGDVGVLAMLDVAWRVRLPQTSVVLGVLGSTASDKAVGKAARRAAHKLRSARS